MFIYDLIKIRYTGYGYLLNYPYHLVSDKEMFNAFIKNDLNFFDINYPNPDSSDEELTAAYTALKTAIMYHIDMAIATVGLEKPYELPDFVVSYMLGSVIGVNSDPMDIRDLSKLLRIPNDAETFSPNIAKGCYAESTKWLKKTAAPQEVTYNGETINPRPATIFGEAHVIKSLRLDNASPF